MVKVLVIIKKGSLDLQSLMYSKILHGLDEAQRSAVLSKSPRILIVAPPGSGKTRVLAARFARLVEDGVSPGRMLAITFTNRAAKEMKERVAGLVGVDTAFGNIGTFHGFCLKFLKRARPALTLFGREEGISFLKEIGVKNATKAAEEISAFKNLFHEAGSKEAPCPEAFGLYQRELALKGGVDLDDLIIETIKILEGNTAAPEKILLAHVMVDEFQDINPMQARLIRLLSSAGSDVFAIGDPDQAIYSFRGSSLKSFMDFEREGAEVIKLKKNYRSPDKIVRASHSLIENNRERIKNTILPVREGGEVYAVECADEASEAQFIIREIESRMGGLSSLTVGAPSCEARFSDFAVIYRTNSQAEPLRDAFSRSSIPYHAVGPPGPEFSDFIAHLKAKGKGDEGIAEFIKAEGESLKIPGGLLDIFITTAALYGGARGKEGLASFLEEMLLMEPADNLDVKADKVNLMTIHTAKGLEFDTVFITGVEDGLVPLKLKKEETDIEEERRLFYVGITRAKERLYLINTRSRRLWGRTVDAAASPFLKEIPEELVKRISIEKKKAQRRPVQKGLFE